MSDVKSPASPLFLRDGELDRGMELLFFAGRDFIAECDDVLGPLGLGRAHHRVLWFVARNPGVSIARLLAILKITKQSLGRAVATLVRTGHIVQARGSTDRRRRLLTLTDKGRELERRLSLILRRRLARAYRAAGGQAVEGFAGVLLGLIADEDRARFAARRAA